MASAVPLGSGCAPMRVRQSGAITPGHSVPSSCDGHRRGLQGCTAGGPPVGRATAGCVEGAAEQVGARSRAPEPDLSERVCVRREKSARWGSGEKVRDGAREGERGVRVVCVRECCPTECARRGVRPTQVSGCPGGTGEDLSQAPNPPSRTLPLPYSVTAEPIPDL